MQQTQVRSLGWEDPLEKEKATLSSIPAWKIPRTGEPGGLQPMGLPRVGHDTTKRLSDWAQEHRFALQRCISFYSAARCISYKYTYIPSLLDFLAI